MEGSTNSSTILTCNQQSMLGFYIMLSSMLTELNRAYEKAKTAESVFEGSYEGEAEVELRMFLESLPMHLYRLMVFYRKLMDFVYTTAMSVYENDMMMSGNMEG